jgi:phosphoribosylformylglycinamidine (FGAM) synthase-like enzyme
MATIAFKREGDAIILIGDGKGHLAQSLYLREIEGLEEGAPPPVDLACERRNGDFVRHLIESGAADTVHDISDGGLLVALAEMAMAGRMGVKISLPAQSGPIGFLFGEDQSRYLLGMPAGEADRVLDQAGRAGAPAIFLGRTGGDKLEVAGLGEVTMDALRGAHEGWFPAYMSPDELPPTN